MNCYGRGCMKGAYLHERSTQVSVDSHHKTSRKKKMEEVQEDRQDGQRGRQNFMAALEEIAFRRNHVVVEALARAHEWQQNFLHLHGVFLTIIEPFADISLVSQD